MSDTERNVDFTFQRIKESTSGMWQDFYGSELRPFGKRVIYANHFTSWVPDEWTITEVNASAQVLLDLRNGVLRDTPAGAENDGTNMQLGGAADGETTGESWAPAAGKNLWFETRLALITDADQTKGFWGLHVEDTTVVASRGTDYIGFRVDDGDGIVDAESVSGSATATEHVGLATLTDNGYVTLGFKVTGVDKIEYYVNDVLKATSTTNIPTGLMKLTLAYLAGEGSANAIGYDYVIAAQDV